MALAWVKRKVVNLTALIPTIHLTETPSNSIKSLIMVAKPLNKAIASLSASYKEEQTWLPTRRGILNHVSLASFGILCGALLRSL